VTGAPDLRAIMPAIEHRGSTYTMQYMLGYNISSESAPRWLRCRTGLWELIFVRHYVRMWFTSCMIVGLDR
jgi:hypothetical protein